jgi:hypothetical protein
MSEVSYFQHYSQRENHLTNNTLLMLRHIYRHSVAKFENLVAEIMGDANTQIGLVFNQQVKAHDSIPDAVIQQSALNIYIEAKKDGCLDVEQLARHVSSIQKAGHDAKSSVLVGLTKKMPGSHDMARFKDMCHTAGVNFIAVTYAGLVEALHKTSAQHEESLLEVIADYENFLRKEGMFLNPFEIVVFPCGTSWQENIEYGMYYEGSYRTSKSHIPYIGIYTNKRITHIGINHAAILCKKADDETIIFTNEHKSASSYNKQKIKEMIDATPYYDLGKGIERFYIINSLQEVNIIKESSGGMMGLRYLDLQKISGGQLSVTDAFEEIAAKVSGKTFQ